MKTKTERRVEFARLLSELILRAYNEHGIEVAVYWWKRTTEQQQALYAIGRTVELEKRTVTDCDGIKKRSKHQDWLAGDLCIIDPGPFWVWEKDSRYETLGKIAKDLELTHGGDWGDNFHFEYKERPE